MAKIVDNRGNEFKVGCVASKGKNTVEVLKISEDGTTIWNIEGKFSNTYAAVVMQGFTILHYKELAPDENNFMLCEGDTALGGWGSDQQKVIAFFNGYFILENPTNVARMEWVKQDKVFFVSRPTDPPAKSAEAIALEQLIKDGEANLKSQQDTLQQMKEALKKAKE
jgi:hypothetical protein